MLLGYTAPGARTAVPIALNSRPPAGNGPMSSDTPTTPCPPSAAHSAVIRPMALRRASYIVCTNGPNDAQPPLPETCVVVWYGDTAPKKLPPHDPGQ